jgi:predicted small metal-binding protein
MMVFRCRDMGVECEWTGRAETETELVEEALEHGKVAHELEPTPELAAAVRRVIRRESEER